MKKMIGSRLSPPRLSLRTVLLTLLLAFAPLASQAQEAPSLPAADQQAIQQYTLTEDVFNRLIAATKEARAAGIKPAQPSDPSKIHNLDDLANQAVGTDARITPIITKNGFTAREFMLANIALMNAAIAVQAQSNPEMAAQIDKSKINQANVAFFQSHQEQIMALMQGPQAQ
ncbi:MAG: hypothetical protein ABW154_05900 [Dyella sp.]